jgi:hypothetical protein
MQLSKKPEYPKTSITQLFDQYPLVRVREASALAEGGLRNTSGGFQPHAAKILTRTTDRS